MKGGNGFTDSGTVCAGGVYRPLQFDSVGVSAWLF